MARLFELFLLTCIAWVVWSQVLREWRGGGGGPPRRRPPPPPPASSARYPGPPPPENTLTLVRCHGCGVHVPNDRVLATGDGRVFCSAACRSRGGA